MRPIKETKKRVYPIAEEVNGNMLIEMKDITCRREANMKITVHKWALIRKGS